MIVALSGKEMAGKLEKLFPGSIVESDENSLVVKSKSLLDIASFLKTSPDFYFDYLTFVTAVDYVSYFEVIYQLTSTVHKHRLLLKVRIDERDNPTLPSVINLWYGADLQEREIYDLMGIRFEGHPNMKRIFLWEGFQGHPLRKDFK